MQSKLDGNFKDLVQHFWIPHAILALVSFLQLLACFSLVSTGTPVFMCKRNCLFSLSVSESLST